MNKNEEMAVCDRCGKRERNCQVIVTEHSEMQLCTKCQEVADVLDRLDPNLSEASKKIIKEGTEWAEDTGDSIIPESQYREGGIMAISVLYDLAPYYLLRDARIDIHDLMNGKYLVNLPSKEFLMNR